MMTLLLVIPRLLHYEESKKFRCTSNPRRNLVLEQHLSRRNMFQGNHVATGKVSPFHVKTPKLENQIEQPCPVLSRMEGPCLRKKLSMTDRAEFEDDQHSSGPTSWRQRPAFFKSF
jgi:hypothetical protein